MAVILQFPRVGHYVLVVRHAGRMLAVSKDAAEQYLWNHLDMQAAIRSRRRIDYPQIIEHHKAMQAAMQLEVCRLVRPGRDGGAA
jgi:hypothetical protein